MGVKNASSCMKMAASLIAITCVLLGITPANSQEKTYDYGMDPTIVKNPADNDLPRAQGPFHKIPKLGSLLTRGGSSDNTTFELYSSQEPQETNPMFPAGRSHLPTATIDMNPEVLARLREWAKVDGTKIRQINAYSPSMGRTIPLVWIPAKDTSQPRPVLYALGGGDGGQGENNWITRTDMVDYMRERNVHVIMPMLGAYSLYSDWETELPAQGGKQMWETFLTHELPGPLEKAIGTNGKRSLIGMSMSGATALIYATHQPGLYDSVGSLSGCGLTNSWVGRRTVAATIYNAPAEPDDPWGPMNSPQSRYNDVYINAEKLADQPNLYVFSASGHIWHQRHEWPQRAERMGEERPPNCGLPDRSGRKLLQPPAQIADRQPGDSGQYFLGFPAHRNALLGILAGCAAPLLAHHGPWIWA